MIQKKVTLGLKYSIDTNEKNRFLKKVHSELLTYLNDIPNSHPNIYSGITNLNFRQISNIGIKQIVQSCVTATKQFLGLPLPVVCPIDLDITYRRQFNFIDYSIIDFEYNVQTQTLTIEALLQIEDLYLIDTYSNKLLIINLADVANYNNNIQISSYSIIDNNCLVVLGLN